MKLDRVVVYISTTMHVNQNIEITTKYISTNQPSEIIPSEAMIPNTNTAMFKHTKNNGNILII